VSSAPNKKRENTVITAKLLVYFDKTILA